MAAKSKLEWALAHARAGFNVFPVVPNKKTPLIERWQIVATGNETQVEIWWTKWPNANIGIALGPQHGGFVVIDEDPRNGGTDTVKALMKEHPWPQTLGSITAGGGVHYYYRTDKTVRFGKNVLGAGVDIPRYVVAPGSTIDGKEYRWFKAGKSIADAPEWLLALSTAAKPRSASAGKRLVEEDDEAVERATNWLVTHAPEAVEGDRDNTAFRVAAKLYDFGVSKATARDMLLKWNDLRCNPPLSDEDIERIVHSAGKNRAKPIGVDHPDNANGFEPVVIRDRQVADNDKKDERRGLYYLTLAECEAKIAEPRAKHLIQGVVPARSMVITYGESGQGKSFHVMDRDMHLAGAKPWRDRPVVPGAVVWVAAELSDDLYARIAAVKQHLALGNDTPFFPVPCPVDLLNPKGDTKPLIELIKTIEKDHAVKVVKVTIDTLSRAMAGGNENGPEDMGMLVKHLDAIRYACDATVEAIHHTGKDTARGARGHSLLRAATDTEIEIGNGRIKVTKQRAMAGGDEWDFRLIQRRVGLDHEGKEVISCYVETRQKGAKGTADWRVPMTQAEEELFKKLKVAAGKHDKKGFTWEVAAILCRSADSDKLPARSTVVERLSALVGKGWLKKGERGQYLVSLSESLRQSDTDNASSLSAIVGGV